ncbi:hypothetical protein [Streptomyces goshikiensis]|uniref:hypothetical protein n=1 Tax=Streptomyces goshikiensis TaxID=1942 RepID=UPI0036C011E3
MLLTQIGIVIDVVVAGQGYVGLPFAVRAAKAGHRVVGCDVDLHRIRLTARDSYVEDVVSSRLPLSGTPGCHVPGPVARWGYGACADPGALDLPGWRPAGGDPDPWRRYRPGGRRSPMRI